MDHFIAALPLSHTRPPYTLPNRISISNTAASTMRRCHWPGEESAWRWESHRCGSARRTTGSTRSPGWWVGSFAENVTLGVIASDEAVHRLFAGKDPATGEQRMAPLWRADPRSKLDAAPLTAALRNLAASRGVELPDLAGDRDRLRKQLEALPRSRKVNAATADRLCRTVLGQDVRELYGDAYEAAAKHVGKRVDARVAAFDLSFSDVKSVSLLAAGGSADVRRQVQAARTCAGRSRPHATRP